jgi:superfamily II DNA or RNA helicase
MDSLQQLPYFNSTNYPLAVRNQLAGLKYDEAEEVLLKYHQFITKKFFTENPHQRGMLICHSMGRGKTRLAAAIATHFRSYDSERQVIVLSAKSLEANFRKEVATYVSNLKLELPSSIDDYIDANYKFVSLNASNMFKQMRNVDKSADEIAIEKRFGEFIEYSKSSLENSLLIVDEAHNLFNSITNGAKNAVGLYDLIMKTTNLKLIFMSGTPIINDPFELVPCFNMLRGMIKVNTSRMQGGTKGSDETTPDIDIEYSFQAMPEPEEVTKRVPYKAPTAKPRNRPSKKTGIRSAPDEYVTLFSEDNEEFEDYFVNHEARSIKNKDKFTNRIYGLVSYYGDLYFESDKEKPNFPKELETIVEKIPMSHTQFARYMSARITEREESRRIFKHGKARFSSLSGSASTTYRVKSRQISNYCIPEYALGPIRGQKAREKFIDKITDDDLRNLDEFSPKMKRIIENINKHPNDLGIVYSQFVSGEGVYTFSRVLEALGYRKYGESFTSDESDYDMKKPDRPTQPTFAILTGDIEPEERAKIIATFNTVDNTHGKHIKLLLMSGAVAEGIDLKRVRHVHIMEPFWNYARINQVKTRAIRYLSHDDLPESDRNVQVYVYLSDYPEAYPAKKITEKTTDIDLYDNSLDNMHIINTFMLALVEASIDCAVHHSKLPAAVQDKIKCKLCAPDSAQLFHPILYKDMELPSTCKPFSEKKVTVEEILLPDSDEKFYYKKDEEKINLYHFNKKLNGYAPMLRSHPKYGQLMEAVMSLS